MEVTNEATRILEKGPEYLRKQMELESESKGHLSAVERLAATKQKYVKSETVANSVQEPAISLGSPSVSSVGSSTRSSKRSVKLAPAACAVEKKPSPGQVRRCSSKKRPDSLLLYRQKCELLRGSTLNRKHHVTRKLLRSSRNKNAPLPEAADDDEESESEENAAEKSTLGERQKECSSPVAQSEANTNGEAEKRSADAETKPKGDAGNGANGFLKVPEIARRPGKGVSRSHSDISSRYSKNFADFDNFFKYCGLEGEVIESLGKENFSARSDEIAVKIRSVSVSTSDGGFSKHSSDSDGLLEDELHKKKRQGTSVIERNARIIKWLYSCKNAKETGKKLRDLE
ncbi:unnamed protein product [Ophioblennius macclurei]